MDSGHSAAESGTLRIRIARLAEAILHISEDLDLDSVLQEIADGARSLTDARYSAIATLDDAGKVQDLLISGLTPEEKQALRDLPKAQGYALFDYLTGFTEPLRTAELGSHIRSVGFPEGYLPEAAFLGLRIRDREKHIGNIFISTKESGGEFTAEDEETVELFAAQAAMAITNARRFTDEQRAKADLEALIGMSPVGVLVLDARTREVAEYNREAYRIFAGTDAGDTPLDQLIEQTSLLRIDGREIPREELPMERAATSGETVRAEEFVVHRPDGGTVTTLISATPIHADDGGLVSAIVTIQDITPLEELERMRAEFLGMVSHELRAPLTAIKGSAATVRDASVPLDPAEVRQFFRIVEEQADKMRDLINNLLDLTRIEAGTLSVTPEPTDLVVVIEQARNAFASSGQRNTIEVNAAPSLPSVMADRQRIVQVLYNLFANASKHSHEWSTIRVGVKAEGPHVAVSVTDDGVGIAAEQMPLLFSKFAQYHGDAAEGRVDGHGLGLAVCKGIVETHGGRIWAESSGHGHGARFTFTVPTVEEAGGTARAGDVATADSEPASAGGERILVVDDDPQTIRYVRHTLARAGYAPVVTDDPREVDRLLEDENPHLVLLDLVLPGIDGFDLLKRVLGVADVPTIVLSGRGGDQDVARAFDMGAADYVVKPFSPTELLARIRAALKQRAVTRQATPYLLGELAIDYVQRSVTVAGRPTRLTPTEYRLLCELSTNAGRALTYDQLLERVWEQSEPGDIQRVRTFVKDLRRKLGDDARNPTYILTESGVGYRMATP